MTIKLTMPQREDAAVRALQHHLEAMGAQGSIDDCVDQLVVVMGAAAVGIWKMAGRQQALDCIALVLAKAQRFEPPPDDDDPAPTLHRPPGRVQ